MAVPMAPWATSQESQQDFEFSQTQRDPVRWDDSLGQSQVQNSQVNPRNKYWAVFTSTSGHKPIKLYWPASVPAPDDSITEELPGESGTARLGRGPYPRFNDIVFSERRISNKHCVIGRLDENVQKRRDTHDIPAQHRRPIDDAEPIVYIEDLGSSNGTYVNGRRIASTPHKQILVHGDEISLGSESRTDEHDVRFVYRSVGEKDKPTEPLAGIFDKYIFREQLGRGTFAEVKKAVEVDTGLVRAVKCITRHRFASNPRTLHLFEREIQILESLEHENICSLIEVFDDPQHIYLVLEYVDGGDLLDYIMKHTEPGPGLEENQAKDFTRMICRAMAYTHSRGVTHRDLKPENILLTSDNPPIIKVADFGLAKMVDEGTALRSMVGTPQYLAPEVVMQGSGRGGYENVVDSWAVGVIVYSMMTNALPFDEDPDDLVHERIRKRVEQPFDYDYLHRINMSEAGVDFIECLLRKDPAQRMTLTGALDHAWLRGEELPDSIESAHGRRLGHRQNGSYDAMSHTSTVHGLDGVEETPHLQEGSSCGDFSYPMDQLRLQTPGGTTSSKKSLASFDSTKARLAGQSSFFGGSLQSDVSLPASLRRMVQPAPPPRRLEANDDVVEDSQAPEVPDMQDDQHDRMSLQGPPSPIAEALANVDEGAISRDAALEMDVRVVDYAGVPRTSASAGTSSVGTSLRKRRFSQSSSWSSSPLSSLPDESELKVVIAGPARKRVAPNPPAPTRSSARIRQSTGPAAGPKTPTKRTQRK